MLFLFFAAALQVPTPTPAPAPGPAPGPMLRLPRLMDCIHFMLYNPKEFVGHERGGLIAFLREDDGSVDLNYMTGRQIINGVPETDNPPDFWEHKIRVPYDNTERMGRTYHYCEDHP